MQDSGLIIRPARSDEIGDVLALWRDAAYGASPTDDAASIDALLSRDGGALLLAFDEGRMVGSIIAGWDGWRGGLYRLAVLPSHRRRGIGARLVAHAEDCLRSLGARRIGALVERDNERARAFWAAQGYAVATSQERFVKDVF